MDRLILGLAGLFWTWSFTANVIEFARDKTEYDNATMTCVIVFLSLFLSLAILCFIAATEKDQ